MYDSEMKVEYSFRPQDIEYGPHPKFFSTKFANNTALVGFIMELEKISRMCTAANEHGKKIKITLELV